MPQISFSDGLSLFGIAVSVIFGVFGIYLTMRRVKYPAHLTFVREQSISLLDDFATRIPNLTVLYKDTPLNKSVVLLSGYLVNDGSVDLTPEMAERPLTCALPTGCAWLEFKLTGATEDLQALGEITTSNILKLTFGLFRRDEAFSFQALVLLDDAHSKLKPTTIVEKLRWSHRIAGLGDIKTTALPQSDNKSWKRKLIGKSLFSIFIIGYLLMGISHITGIGPLGQTPFITYAYEHNGKMTNVRLIPNKDGTTTITDLNTQATQRVHLDDLTKVGKFTPIYERNQKPDALTIFSGFAMVLMAIFFGFQAFSNDYKRYRARRMIRATTRAQLFPGQNLELTKDTHINALPARSQKE